MKKLLGALLIIAALAFGYFGYTKLDDSQAKLKIGDLEISAQDSNTQRDAYILFALGAVSLIAGLYLIRSRD